MTRRAFERGSATVTPESLADCLKEAGVLCRLPKGAVRLQEEKVYTNTKNMEIQEIREREGGRGNPGKYMKIQDFLDFVSLWAPSRLCSRISVVAVRMFVHGCLDK